jgi:hypothetical protein
MARPPALYVTITWCDIGDCFVLCGARVFFIIKRKYRYTLLFTVLYRSRRHTNMFSPHLNTYPQENYSQTFSNQNQIPLSSPVVPQNLWQTSQLSQQNSLSWNQQHQNPPGQSSGVQPQSHNGLASLPYISQQLVQDALRMSAPVGSSPNDEAIMVQILYESSVSGQTYKQALESLHGVRHSLPINMHSLICPFRSTTTRPVFGKITISTTSHVSTV